MIILIGGSTHAGKTLMAQNLMEKYRIPYTSLDHIKMGLCRISIRCGFTPLDSDERISQSLWGVIKGIADTCSENGQNIILEGCYLPPEKTAALKGDIIIMYIILSAGYIKDNLPLIIKHENDIEKRRICGDFSMEELMRDNEELEKKCRTFALPFVRIEHCYADEITQAYRYIDCMYSRLSSARKSDG